MADLGENKFHEHLDGCPQCENAPFNLCPIGESLLREVYQGIIWKRWGWPD